MKAVARIYPGVQIPDTSITPVVIPSYDPQLASWDELTAFISPEKVTQWADPIYLKDRARDVPIGKNGSLASPTAGTLNTRAVFQNGSLRTTPDVNVMAKTSTIAFVAQFDTALPTNTKSVMFMPGGGILRIQGTGQPALVNPYTEIPYGPMPVGTVVAGTPYFFMWASDEGEDKLYQQVNSAVAAITGLNAKVPVEARRFQTNFAGDITMRLGMVHIFSGVNLFKPANARRRAEVEAWHKAYYGLTY